MGWACAILLVLIGYWLRGLRVCSPEGLRQIGRHLRRAIRRWRGRARGGRPPIDAELIALIQRMSFENPLWGAPRIHGELLKLGFRLAQSTVSKYMIPRKGRPRPAGRSSCARTPRPSPPSTC